jgi:hypothetical protein
MWVCVPSAYASGPCQVHFSRSLRSFLAPLREKRFAPLRSET